MVSKQREQLHLRAAEWYIAEYPSDVMSSSLNYMNNFTVTLFRYSSKPDAGVYYATILHHYENADNPQEALQYALKSAEYLFFYFILNLFILTCFNICGIHCSTHRVTYLL